MDLLRVAYLMGVPLKGRSCPLLASAAMRVLLPATLACAFFQHPACAVENSLPADMVAVKVNRTAIHRRTFEKAFIAAWLDAPPGADPEKLWKRIVEETIDEELLDQKAGLLRKLLREESARRYVQRLRRLAIERNGGRENWEKALAGWGMTIEDWEKITERSFFTKFWIIYRAGLVNVGPDEIKAYYEAHPKEFTSPDRYRVGKIEIASDALLPVVKSAGEQGTPGKKYTPELAREFLGKIRDKLAAAESGRLPALFTTLAKKYSTGREAAAGGIISLPGGVLPTAEDLSPSDRRILASLSESAALSEVYPVGGSETGVSWTLLWLAEKISGSVMPFDAVAPEIFEKLQEERYEQARRQVFADLRRYAIIIKIAVDFPTELVKRMKHERRSGRGVLTGGEK